MYYYFIQRTEILNCFFFFFFLFFAYDIPWNKIRIVTWHCISRSLKTTRSWKRKKYLIYILKISRGSSFREKTNLLVPRPRDRAFQSRNIRGYERESFQVGGRMKRGGHVDEEEEKGEEGFNARLSRKISRRNCRLSLSLYNERLLSIRQEKISRFLEIIEQQLFLIALKNRLWKKKGIFLYSILLFRVIESSSIIYRYKWIKLIDIIFEDIIRGADLIIFPRGVTSRNVSILNQEGNIFETWII